MLTCETKKLAHLAKLVFQHKSLYYGYNLTDLQGFNFTELIMIITSGL